MSNSQESSNWKYVRKFARTCDNIFSTVSLITIPMLVMLFIVTFAIRSVDKVQIIYIDIWKEAPYKTSPKFLSITLDSSVIADGFHNFNMSNNKLLKMIQYLHPAHLRVGGTLADRLYFSPDLDETDINVQNFYRLFRDEQLDLKVAPNFNITGVQWLNLMKLVKKSDLDIFFDLNALIRFPNGSWDYRNAETLIKFSNDHNLRVNWELGNEPNLFRKTFGEVVNATQLSKDIYTLRKILDKYPLYRKALLVGPDTTRPLEKHKESAIYLQEFLKNGVRSIDAITWHQYYINGRTAVAENFLDPEVFDLLKSQILQIRKITQPYNVWNKPIWLGETSSAYGGGAPILSNTFIGSFIWVDKLGLAAKLGVKMVMRQSVFKGYYALLDNNYDPNPDWWISVLYKKFVGTNVVPAYTACLPKVRLYSHCTKRNVIAGNPTSITVFGVNMGNSSANIRIEGLYPHEYELNTDKDALLTTVYAFEITAKDSLFSHAILLNGRPLKMSRNNTLPEFVPKVISLRPFVTMPPLSVVFWVIPSPRVRACYL